MVRLLCNLVHASSDCECYAAGWAQAAAGGVRHLRGHADQVQELAAAVTAGRTRAGQAHEDWHQSHQASNTSHGEHFSLTFIDHGIGNELFFVLAKLVVSHVKRVLLFRVSDLYKKNYLKKIKMNFLYRLFVQQK